MKQFNCLILVLALLISANARADAPATQPAGTLVTLHLKNVPGMEAVKALQDQSGVKIDAGQVASERLRESRLSIDIDNQPFWEAVAILCQPRSLRPDHIGYPPRIQLVAQNPSWRPVQFFLDGRVAVSVARTWRVGDVQYATQSSGARSVVVVDVYPEPTLGVDELSSIKIEKCLDESGHDVSILTTDNHQSRALPVRVRFEIDQKSCKLLSLVEGTGVLHRVAGQNWTFKFQFKDVPLPATAATELTATSQPAEPTPLPAATPDFPIDYAKRIDAHIARLQSLETDERQAGVIGLAMLPPDALDALQAAAKRQDLPPSISQPLKSVLAKQKIWEPTRKKRMAFEAEAGQFGEKLALDAYQKIGHRDAAWDQQVVDAIHLYFTATERHDLPRMRQAFEEAMLLGCDDPLVISLAANSLERAGAETPRVLGLYDKAGDGLAANLDPLYFRFWNAARSSAFRQLAADGTAAERHADIPNNVRHQINEQEELALSLFPEFAQQKMPPLVLQAAAELVLTLSTHVDHDAERARKVVIQSLEKAKVDQAFILRTESHYLIQFAWQARTRSPSGKIDQNWMTLFQSRIADAERPLEKAYALDPGDPEVSGDMVNVALGLGYSPAVMEDWFQKAAKADPDYSTAYYTKLNYIRPAWYGKNDGAAEEFGDQCFRAENWRGLTAFIKATKYEGLSKGQENIEAYYKSPEVWNQIREVYEPYLLAEPDDVDTRSRYCAWACWAGRWDVAHKQFEMLGGNYSLRRFKSAELLQKYLQQAGIK